MRTLGALADHLAGYEHTLCSMLRLDLRDGTIMCFTDHDADLVFDLGDGAQTYSASTGILPSSVTLAVGFDADNFEISGPIGDVITAAAVRGGRFRRARAKLFYVNWSDLSQGPARIIAGRVGEARVEAGEFVLEVRSPAAEFGQIVGRVLTPYCTATFGDEKCGVTKTPVACEVVEVTSRFQFRVDLGGEYADNYFRAGTVEFLTGALAGTEEVEVAHYGGTDGSVELLAQLGARPQVGDTLNIYRGCSKVRKSDDPSVPTCLTYENVVNFRGFPDVPGSDVYLKVGTPEADGG